MPNIFTDNRDRWLSLSEVDYFGQFVKAWLAFNAWYRGAYTATRDREIIDEIKWNSNPVLNRVRPLLNNGSTEEAVQCRAEVGLLHHRLQNYEIHVGKGATKERITLERVYLRDNPPCNRTETRYRYSFAVIRRANGNMQVDVKNAAGTTVLSHTQTKHAFAEIEALADFGNNLTVNLQGILRSLYNADDMKPRVIANLTAGTQTPIRCGSYDFRCSADDLFAGVVEAIYQMRCTLFHGELNPTREANACFEPAYYLVRRFLQYI